MTLTQEHLEVRAQRYTAAQRGQDPTSLLVFRPNGSLGVDDEDLPSRHGRVIGGAVNWVVA